MLVFDKVVDNDRRMSTEPPGPFPELTSTTTLPNGETVALLPAVKDAFSVFEDLCLLANLEHPRFLKLESLPKTFSLELIESVLTNYHDLFRQVRSNPSCHLAWLTQFGRQLEKRTVTATAAPSMPDTAQVSV